MTTLLDLAASRYASTPEHPAYTVRDARGAWHDVAWREVSTMSAEVGAGLVSAGVRPGDRVAVLGPTCLAWVIAMNGIHAAGGVVSTIYPSSTPEEIAFIVEDSGCVALFASDPSAYMRAALASPPNLRTVVLFEGEQQGALSWTALRSQGAAALTAAPRLLDAIRDAVKPDDLAALVYTSGTTGLPKGVMLSHANFTAVALGIEAYLPAEPDDSQLLFLPLSHVFGMVVCLVAMHTGGQTILEPDMSRIGQTLLETRPTFMPGVPRVFEKIFASAEARARARGPSAHKVFSWAAEVARRWSRAKQAGGVMSPTLRLQRRLADRLVFRKVREGLGGRIRAFSSGAAPLAPDLAHFFHGAGMVVLEGYGMTESAAITTVNPLEGFRIGTVGIHHDQMRVRIAEDGEVLICGPAVTRGYWNRPEETRATLIDGWLHTGDIGRFDEHGHLCITDRKKHILITAGGKNIAPAPIEAALVAGVELIRLAMLHGDRRPYCVALVELDPEATSAWFVNHSLHTDAPLDHAALHAHLERELARVNSSLPSYATVKRLRLLRREPSVQSGELTPSLKLRRAVLEERYLSDLDSSYRAAAPVVSACGR